MREFHTAVKANLDEDVEGVIEFPIIEEDADGNEVGRQICRAFPPDTSQVAVAMAGVGRHVETTVKVATIIDFFNEVLDDSSSAYMRRRLLDRRDPFGLEQVSEILKALMEEWTGRPTQEPQGSSQRQGSSGPSSTRRTSRRTSSASGSIAS